MKDMQVTGITVEPEDVGFDPDEYAGYTFRSAQNVPGTSTNEGLTFEYSQQLTFLPGAFKGLSLYGSITAINPDGERQNVPEQVSNWGLRYNHGRFDFQINGNRQGKYRVSALSNTPTTANNGILYHTERELWNISASYKLTKNIELQLAGRNIFNEPDIIYSNVPSRVQQYTIDLLALPIATESSPTDAEARPMATLFAPVDAAATPAASELTPVAPLLS